MSSTCKKRRAAVVVKMTKVKDCPHRIKENHAMRGSREPDIWVQKCNIQTKRYPDGMTGPTDVSCHLHGNCALGKCEFYNEWSLKEVREAFKKLDEAEAHRDAVLGALRM
jgi:hypothetical protein